MKTTSLLLKIRSLGSLIIFSLILTSCGSFTGVSYYDQDGIYSSPSWSTYEIPLNARAQQNIQNTQNTQNGNPNEFGTYFLERANTYEDLLTEDNFTAADEYVSGDQDNWSNDQPIDHNQNISSQSAWGGNPEQVTIKIHNNPWFNQGLYFNSFAGRGMGGRWGRFNNFGGGFNNWGWNANPWGWGFNNWGWNADPWGWGFNNFGGGFNNWGWNGWAFNNPQLFYGSYNYSRVQHYARNNRFDRSPNRTSYAVNATRRGSSNQEQGRGTYALRKNTLSVSGLRSYLRTTEDSKVVDSYRNNNQSAGRNTTNLSGLRNSIQTSGIRSNAMNSGSLNSHLRNSINSSASAVRNNSLVRAPRATRSNETERNVQSPNNQLFRSLTPNMSSYRSGGSRSSNTNTLRSVSPIMRTSEPSSIRNNQRQINSSDSRSNYRSSGSERTSSSPTTPTRSSGNSSSGRSSSSSRSNGRNN